MKFVKRSRQRRKSLPGYSLIEIAIGLTIMGTVMGVGLPLLTSMNESSKNKKTSLNQERVAHALSHYVVKNGHLPAPSPVAGLQQKGAIMMGRVPAEKLGLSPEIAQDGFGNAFVYAVPSQLVKLSAESRSNRRTRSQRFMSDAEAVPKQQVQKICQAKSAIRLIGHDRQVLVDENQNIAFVLIGFSARGILRPEGVSAYVNLSADESTNLQSSTKFVQKPPQNSHENQFRQVVFFETIDQLMGYYARSPCKHN